MSEPRYPTRVSDPDQTTRIPKDALDGLRDADHAPDAQPARPGPSTGATASPPAPTRGPDVRPANGSVSGPRNGTGPAGGAGPLGGSGPAGGSFSGPGPAGGSFGPAGGSFSGPGSAGGVTSAQPAPEGRPSSFRSGAVGTNGSGVPAVGPPAGVNGATGSGSAPLPGAAMGASGSAQGPANGSAPGYRRSETGYSPSAYPSPFSGPGYPSLTDAPTTVTGHGATAAGVGLGTGAAASTAAARAALGTAGAPRPQSRPPGSPRPTRRARLLVRHIDPWSTLKFSFVLSIAMFFVWLVAIGVLYGVLDGMGVFDQINGLYDEVSGNGGDSLFSPGLVLGTAALIGVVNIVLFTALATIGSFVYNICADLVGGIEVTLAERD